MRGRTKRLESARGWLLIVAGVSVAAAGCDGDATTDADGGSDAMCIGRADGTSCEAGVCRSGRCVAASGECGNGLVEDGESCDDANDVSCDGCESDCRLTCELATCGGAPTTLLTWYRDCDGDGFAADETTSMTACLEPAPHACGGGWTPRIPIVGAVDCDETDADVHPDAIETCDGIDNNCNDAFDEGLQRACSTACGEGEEVCSGGVYVGCTAPASSAEACNDVDDDCNGLVDDLTRDCSNACGPGVETCSAGSWGACSVRSPSDEVCDGADNDCDGETDEGLLAAHYVDGDGDGHGDATGTVTSVCPATPGYATTNDDCADTNSNAYSGQTSWFRNANQDGPGVPLDGWDYDCSGAVDTQYGTGIFAQCFYILSPPPNTTVVNCFGAGWIGAAPGCGGGGTRRSCIFANGVCSMVDAPVTLGCH